LVPAFAPSRGQRIALRIEYDGSAFGGWQKQARADIPTVQGVLEPAIGRVADAPVKLVCAGRTDSGVHATCQFAHFDHAAKRQARAWTAGVNSLLPAAVRVVEVFPVSNQFNARFSAISRRYVYLVHESAIDSPQLAGRAVRAAGELDVEAMSAASGHLRGERDFSSFQAAGCQSASPNRNVFFFGVDRQRGFVVFDICANAFLQHMVRNIVGTLLEVGRGDRKPDSIRDVLRARDRKAAGATAPAAGLYLVSVGYPPDSGIPTRTIAPPLLDDLPDIQSLVPEASKRFCDKMAGLPFWTALAPPRQE